MDAHRRPRSLLALLVLSTLLAGCGSSATTQTVTHTASETATTQTAAALAPKKLSKKELAEQRTAARKKAAAEAAQSRREAKEAEATTKENKKTEEAAAQESKEKEEEAAAATNAKKLVEVWKQEPVEASDSNVLSIQRHLTSLGHKCSQSVPTLAAEINSSIDILKKEGITETPVEIAAGLDKAAPGKKIASDCQGFLAAMLVLIEKG